MGVILQGILGGFSGKVGPVVGGKWKDIDYMRSYVVPANPNTVGQQAVRTKFAALVALARQLLSNLLQPYWDQYYPSMSGFNAFISQNYDLADAVGAIDKTAIMSLGTLEGLTTVTVEYNTGTGAVDFSWDGTIQGNGLATDNIFCVVMDETTQDFKYAGDPGAFTRVDNGANFTIETGLTATNLIGWVFAYRGTGANLVISDSVGEDATAS